MTLDGIIVTHDVGDIGRGVEVNEDGILIMNDGAISDNHVALDKWGGGVWNEGYFELNGDRIRDNSAGAAGGVLNFGGEFVMFGGSIFGNIADDNDLHNLGMGGGVYNYDSFVMYGGEIYGNTALWGGGGVYNYDSFVMYSGEIYGNTAEHGGGVYNTWDFEMQGGKIYDNVADTGHGGGVYNGNDACAEFDFLGGEIYGNAAGRGGGVYNDDSFDMLSGKIYDNTADSRGGGVCNAGVFDMTYGEIYGNAAEHGAGVHNSKTFSMFGGAIYANVASGDGGGVWTEDYFRLLDDGEISYNEAVSGGGIYVVDGDCELLSGVISGNVASGDGGGVWVTGSPFDVDDFDKLTVASGVVFSNNIAGAAYDRDSLHDSVYNARIGSGGSGVVWSVPFIQGFNNYDIRHNYGSPLVLFDIAYVLNGGTNAVSNPTFYFDSVLPLGIADPSKSGFPFYGWTVTYSGGSTAFGHPGLYEIPLGTTGVVTLNANWDDGSSADPMFSVVYDGNGASGGIAPVDPNSMYNDGSTVTVLGQGSLVRAGYSFLGWSPTSSATTPVYEAGSTFTIVSDTVLYAVWIENTYTVIFEPGTLGTFDAVSTSGLHYGAATPNAPSVTGSGRFEGWSPVLSATVTSNVTYVAQWTQGPVASPSPTPTASPSPTPTPSATPTATPTLSPTPLSSATPTATGLPTPTVFSVPGDFFDEVTDWAVVNLLFVVASVVLAVLAAVWVFLLKKEKSDNDSGDDGGRGGVWLWWLLGVVVLCVVGVVVFVCTQDLSLPFGWVVDKWTIVHVVIFVVEIIAGYACINRRKSELKSARSTAQ